MGIVCKGFDGVLTEYDWAQMSGLMGNMPSVKGATSGFKIELSRMCCVLGLVG